MQILVGGKPGYSVPVFFVYVLLQNEIFCRYCLGFNGKRCVIFQLEPFNISSKKFLGENLGLCMHTIVVVTILFFAYLHKLFAQCVLTMVKSFGENIL